MICKTHIERLEHDSGCIYCQHERMQRALEQLADPFSALTLSGMQQLAQRTIRPEKNH